MKTQRTHRKITGTLALCLLFHFGVSAQAQTLVNTSGAGVWSWMDGTKWTGGVPGNPATQKVILTNGINGSIRTILLDIADPTQTLPYGLETQHGGGSTAGRFVLDLNGKKLIINGELATLSTSTGSTSNNVTIPIMTFTSDGATNGIVQLGTAGNAASLSVGGGISTAAGDVSNGRILSMVFDNKVTLDTANTTSIIVVANSSNKVENMALDLSAATLVSGTNAATLAVQDSIAIGQQLAATGITSSRHKYGQLLMGVVEHLNIGKDLIIGQNARTSSTDFNANGSLSFSTAPAQGALDMHIGRDLRIGVGAGATGSITNTPDTLNLTIGSDTTRGGVVYVGYKNVATATGNASGTFNAKEGTFSAYITQLSVGRNDHATDGTAIGTLDFGDSTLETLDISGSAIIGQGHGANGTVKLKGGEASSTSLTVGGLTAGTGLLDLNGTTWTTETLTVGSGGSIALTLSTQSEGGIDITTDADAAFTLNGLVTVHFDNDSLWGIRMLGDHVDLLKGFVTNGRLVGVGGDVFKDDTYTYFAVIPEPSTALLLMLGGLAVMAFKFRRNS